MADNVVEIVVRSRNETKGGFDSAKRDAELAGDEAGQGFVSRFMSRMTSSFGNEATGGGGFLSSITGIATSSPEGFAAIGIAVGALAAEVTGLATGIVAAGLGLGAFGILSAGTFGQLKQDVGQYSAALDTLNQKQNVLAVTQANYAADPSKANKAALAAAQKAVDTAQTNFQAVKMGMGQDAGNAAAGIDQLRIAYDKLSASFAPVTFQFVNDALKVANTLLPSVGVLARAAAPAILSVMTSLDKAVAGPGFKAFIQQMATVAPVAIKQLGSLLGTVGRDLGQFLTLMNKQDVYNAFRVAIDSIDVVLKGVTISIKLFMTAWDLAWDLMHGRTVAAGEAINSFVKAIPGRILNDLQSLPGLLVHAGASLIDGLIRGIKSAMGPLGSFLSGIAGFIAAHKGPLDADAVLLFPHGQAMIDGLMRGIGSRRGALGSQLAGITGDIGGGVHVGGGGQLTLQVASGGSSDFERFMLVAIRKWVRIYGGGSTQQAFGKAGM